MTKSSSADTSSPTVQVGVHEAKTRFSELLRLVDSGQRVEILRNGKPVAALTGLDSGTRRTFGVDAGRFTVPDDFDAPLPDSVLASFEQ
jgi:prevent-host-death family protein